MEMRVEEDSIGRKNIPNKAYYGIQSERARENFDVSGLPVAAYPHLIYAMAAIKKAAAIANYQVGGLKKEIANAICQAADEAIEGKYNNQFLMDIFQGGGGTSENMNMNEVLANRANEIITGIKGYDVVHPNTHINMGQSTNDVIPSAMKIACYFYIDELIESVIHLEKSLKKKEEEFGFVVKLGRTCIQDALPVTLGQEFSGYHSLIKRRREQLMIVKEKCKHIPLGATAVGTQLTTLDGYMEKVYPELSKILGFEVCPEENLFDGLQNADIYIEISATLKALATGVSKIATDLRMMSSGPNAGIMEIELPAVQPGSSIMPGKINPVMPELINQICYQICGNDLAVTMSVEGGELDLNVWEPVITKCIAESCTLLTNSLRLFTDKCIEGIRANATICREYCDKSVALSTVVAILFGYPKGSKIAKAAIKQNKTIKEVVIDEGVLTKEQADVLLDPMLMTQADAFRKKIKEYKEVENQCTLD